ncbi:MAG TPA: hypothetical protein PLT58_00420 [Atribacterota bacterium]|nr:hypothetical protein [Atribacterota bacterium]HPK86525.1 hypothetical protein [Atribacterota bacterium]
MGAKKEDKIKAVDAAMKALKKIQGEFAGEAERLDLRNEKDVVNLVKEVRKEINQEKAEDK